MTTHDSIRVRNQLSHRAARAEVRLWERRIEDLRRESDRWQSWAVQLAEHVLGCEPELAEDLAVEVLRCAEN